MESRRVAGLVQQAAWLAIAGFMSVGSTAFAAQGKNQPAGATVGKSAVAPAAPVLPAAVVDAMQEGRHDEAGRVLSTLTANAGSTDEKAYFSYLGGIADAWRATVTQRKRCSARRSRSTPRADGRSRSATSSRASSWHRGTGRPPKDWPARKPSGCSPVSAKISLRESTTNMPDGCSSRAIR